MTVTVVNGALEVDEERRRVSLALGGGPSMQAWLASVAGVEVGSRFHVVDAKYQPRSSCLVLYQCGPVDVAVVLSMGAETIPGGSQGGAGADGSAVVAGMRAFVFPDDPVLSGLSGLLDPAVMAPILADALGRPVLSLRTTLLRYRPAKRATLGLSVRFADWPRDRVPLIAKVYSNDVKAAAVYDECRRLSQVIAPSSPLVLADVVAFAPEVPMVLQSHIEGTSLDQLLVVGTATSALHRRAEAGVSAAARALAALHGAPAVSDRVRSASTELVRFARRAGSVAQVDRATGGHLVAVVDLLVAAFARLPAAETTLVHGDAKPSQFRVGPDGGGRARSDAVGLIDFDHCGLADPASDVGAFLASLRKNEVMAALRSHRPASPPPPFRELETGFLDAYVEAYVGARLRADGPARVQGRSPGDADAGTFVVRAVWHEGAALLRKSLRAYARAPRSPLALTLAEHSRSCLELLATA